MNSGFRIGSIMDKIIFLDRDGTINEEVNYLYKREDLRILEGVAEALIILRAAGYQIVVVSNQAGVARGYYTCSDVEQLHKYLNQQLKEKGAWIDHFFFCPHHPTHGIGDYKIDCDCRKPGIGMFRMAEQLYQIDKARSYMIGDKLLDVEAGKTYGVKGILVGTGYGKSAYAQAAAHGEAPAYDCYVENLLAAARYIAQEDAKIG